MEKVENSISKATEAVGIFQEITEAYITINSHELKFGAIIIFLLCCYIGTHLANKASIINFNNILNILINLSLCTGLLAFLILSAPVKQFGLMLLLICISVFLLSMHITVGILSNTKKKKVK